MKPCIRKMYGRWYAFLGMKVGEGSTPRIAYQDLMQRLLRPTDRRYFAQIMGTHYVIGEDS